MVATQRNSFSPTDRTNSQFMPLKVFGSERKRGNQERDQLDTRLIGNSKPMQALKRSIRLVANSSETVLITGESGTGKELIAHGIHDLSARCREPFLAVNCGALTESLVESELFGHVRGAFTGAVLNKKGYFEAAGSGTIFLDEFAEMSLTMQAKLLRVLEDRKVRPVGMTEAKEVSFNARVIVATNHDLKKDVRAGRFRHDLYYRVNVLQIRAPALRVRSNDIELLAKHFIRKYNERNECQVSDEILSYVLDQLRMYSWPGNVRELENVINRLANLLQDQPERNSTSVGLESSSFRCKSLQLKILKLKSQIQHCIPISSYASKTRATLSRREAKRRKELDRYERLLEESNGNISAAARVLKIPRSTLQSRLSVLKLKYHDSQTSSHSVATNLGSPYRSASDSSVGQRF